MPTSDPGSEILHVLPPIMRVIRNEMRGLAQPELTIAQFRILARLSLGGHTNKQLASWMGISAASMSRTVDILVRRGFVTRQSGSSDRREVSLVLSPKGIRKYELIEEATRRKLDQKLRVLSGKDQKSLMTGLRVLKEVFLK